MKKAAVFVFKILIVCSFIILITIGSFKGYKTIKMIIPGYQVANLSEIFGNGIHDENIYVIYEDNPLELEVHPKIIEGKIYLPITLVMEYLNSNFYWDQDESILTYTTSEDVIRMKSDELNYYVNNEPLKLNIPIIQLDDSEAYIPLDLLKQFGEYSVFYNQELDILIVDNVTKESTYGIVTKNNGKLRIKESKRSHYIKTMEPGERVKIYGENESWYKIRTKEGYIGYLQKGNLGEIKIIPGKKRDEQTNNDLVANRPNGKINLAWHQVTNLSANNRLANVLEGVRNLDVLSPTWFAISDSEGNVSNLADISYVEWAHNKGYQVWALFSNSFNASITHDVLSSTGKREKLIKQILAYAAIYKLDGINIDFENVAKEDGIHFVQFIKEITPYLKKQDLIVSVDMYVPSAWTKHYDRRKVGELVDYIMIMAYDEHWSTSPKSGSVASIGFVEKGIVDTLNEVPKEKIILGLPYYTRLWKEEIINEEVVVTSKAYGMNKAYEILVENNAEIYWDEVIAQYYGEYEIDQDMYKIWLEEDRSIEEKLKLVKSYDLAGVAGWKLGLEKEEIWDILTPYLNKEK